MKLKLTVVLALVSLALSSVNVNANVVIDQEEKGLIISGLGLAGCGKSSTFKELNKLMPNAQFFAEPEEAQWPKEIADRSLYDHFTHFTAFRAMRVPLLRKAGQLRDQGQTVLLDAYYDKVNGYYLGRDLVSWLIPHDHPYFDVALEVSLRDIQELPDADVIVLFDIDYDTWYRFVTLRNREQDKDENFQNQYEARKYYEEVAERLAKEKNIKIVRIRQEFSSPEETAKRLYKSLQDENVIPKSS